MFQLQLTEFTQAEFLRDYWQKKPVVIRSGFINFIDPIDANELAGLATEAEVQSRLVVKNKDNWQASFGPFNDYQHLGDKNWSLVVQAVDHWSEQAAKLIEPFRFIPHWRLDDLMVSFATPGGGVGPHIDLYDVFICQGSGSRRWRVGNKGEHREFAAHEALLHVDPFEAIIDTELQPGDILYIPPGFPHDGVTLTTSLSFSVGFRTNSSVSLLSGFADYLIDNECATELIEDAGRPACDASGEITPDDYQLIKNQMLALFDNDTLFRNFTGCFLTQAKHELDLQPEEIELACNDLSQLISQMSIIRLGGLRAFYFPETINQGVCYINGNEVSFSPEIAALVKMFCNNVTLTPQMTTHWHKNTKAILFIKEQISQGYWYFSEPE